MPSHLAIAVASSSWLPQQITVPGDDTEAGQRYAKTFANDHRAKLDWSDKHELQILHLLSTSRRDASDYNVPAEPLSVFLVRRSDSTGLRLNGERFDLVTDDGRQRRRDGVVLNERLRKIAVDYEDDIVAGTLYEALTREGIPRPAWLTNTFAEELSTGPWFNADGSPCLLAFRVDVVAEDPDLDDPAILLDNVRRKEASIPTPLPALAKQYTSLLGAKRGGVALFPHITKLAEKIGKSPQHVRSVLDYEKLDPVLKDAVDKQTIGLGLAVVGPDCIAFVTVDGEKKPLPCEAQVAVYKELAATYAVELDDGIPDNKTTRKGVALIKERLGFGAAKTMAKTVAVVKTEAAPAVVSSPQCVPEASSAESSPRPSPVRAASLPSSRPVSSPTPTPPPSSRLDQLRTLTHPTVTAIVAFLDGKTTMAAVEATLSEGPPAPPFARAEAAKAQILAVLDTVERGVGDLRSVPIADFEATMLRSGLVDGEAIAKLRAVIAAYMKPSTRRHVDIGVHVREMLTE
ncbi:MAG: hypothetical protein E6Q97_28965 [Desulfurellales bacterium]|nr:MAG: hypothetical protein E6Q97_28965 [Desulfurellales bacterium]